MKEKNIFPIHHQMIQRSERERRLNQRALVVWMTGLSGSGKSTIALDLERRLFQEGFMVQLLDGDNIRTGISNNLGFSLEDRKENIRRIAEVSKLFVNCGIICINAFISPTIEIRALAKEIIGAGDFVEVFISTPLSVCEKRDIKGLYKKARAGEIRGFSGINSPYEEPTNPDIIVNTEGKTIQENTAEILNCLIDRITRET